LSIDRPDDIAKAFGMLRRDVLDVGVDAPGGDPSASRVPWSVSAAHSATAVNDRAPASTAHTARLKMTVSR